MHFRSLTLFCGKQLHEVVKGLPGRRNDRAKIGSPVEAAARRWVRQMRSPISMVFFVSPLRLAAADLFLQTGRLKPRAVRVAAASEIVNLQSLGSEELAGRFTK